MSLKRTFYSCNMSEEERKNRLMELDFRIEAIEFELKKLKSATEAVITQAGSVKSRGEHVEIEVKRLKSAVDAVKEIVVIEDDDTQVVVTTTPAKKVESVKNVEKCPDSPFYCPSSPAYSPSSPAPVEIVEPKKQEAPRGRGGRGLGKTSINITIADQNVDIVTKKYKKDKIKPFVDWKELRECMRPLMEPSNLEKLKEEINDHLRYLPSWVNDDNIVLTLTQIASFFVVRYNGQRRYFADALGELNHPYADQFRELLKECIEFYTEGVDDEYHHHDSELFDINVVYTSISGVKYYKIETHGDDDDE